MQQLLMEREKNWSNLRAKLEEAISTKETLYSDYLDLMQRFTQLKQESEYSVVELRDVKNLFNLKSTETESLKAEKMKFLELNTNLNNQIETFKKVLIYFIKFNSNKSNT